jgi:hypothetical protein
MKHSYSYYNKYNKYNKKLDILKKNMIGGKYECNPKNNFNDICIENQNGKYKSKNSCINDCENYYIREQLLKANLIKETGKFYKFIKEIIKNENIDVYIKGGNVIGLQVLKLIYDKYKDEPENFKKYFHDFLELELIKDWDFASYAKNEITDEYKNKLDKIAKKNNLVSRAKRYILYQTKKPILTEGKALFEIAIWENDCEKYSCMEIPLTTMKMRITKFNIKYVFMLAKIFHGYKISKEEFDFDLLKRLISKISIIMYPCKNGFYNDLKNFDDGELNENLIKFIQKYEKEDKNLPQFLVTHIKDPFRMIYRLPEKNIPKTQKIASFLESAKIKNKIDWLFDTDFVKKMIEKFTTDLGNEIEKIYKKDGLDEVMIFLNNIDWMIDRGTTTYKDSFSDYSKELLDNILGKLIKQINKNEINKLDSKNKFYNLLQMLSQK